jgi:hypothetical protein
MSNTRHSGGVDSRGAGAGYSEAFSLRQMRPSARADAMTRGDISICTQGGNNGKEVGRRLKGESNAEREERKEGSAKGTHQKPRIRQQPTSIAKGRGGGES